MPGRRAAKEDSPKTVKELAEGSQPVMRGVDPEDYDANEHSPYAIEDQDVSGFVNVNPEYRTYGSDVHKPNNAGLDENGEPKSASEKPRKAEKEAEQKETSSSTQTGSGTTPPPPPTPSTNS